MRDLLVDTKGLIQSTTYDNKTTLEKRESETTENLPQQKTVIVV